MYQLKYEQEYWDKFASADNRFLEIRENRRL